MRGDGRLGKLRAEVKTAWLEALRSGQYTQTTGYLHVADDGTGGADPGFCCLGVLCDLATQAGVVKLGPRQPYNPGVRTYVAPGAPDDLEYDDEEGRYGLSETMPPDPVVLWAFEELPPEGDNWAVLIERSNGRVRPEPLATLNDDDHLSFTEIADLIEDSL